jgi:NADPH:quinone reductase
MKAVQFSQFGGPDVLKYVEAVRPIPNADDLLIKVTAAGVNYVDTRERAGIYQRKETRVGGVTLPRVQGLQMVGVVTEVGPEGDTGLIGRQVVALLPNAGGYAEFAVAPAIMAIPLPNDTDDIMVAALPTQGVTAYLMLRSSTQLRSGESVLVHGAGGGVGSVAVQIAKSLGAAMVIATAATEEKRELARRMGADAAVNYDEAGWTKKVLEITKGRGVDIILESIGGTIFEESFECLAPFGRYIIFGSTRGPGASFEPRRLMTHSQTITGIYMPVYFAKPLLISEAMLFLVEQVAAGKLRSHVSLVLPLSEAAEAHRRLEARSVIGAVVLKPTD